MDNVNYQTQFLLLLSTIEDVLPNKQLLKVKMEYLQRISNYIKENNDGYSM